MTSTETPTRVYCVGCEHYLTPDELDDAGHCPEHRTPPQHIAERNWFFRLSRYADRLRDAIESGALRIAPAARRNEVLAFINGGLRDFSVSRSQDRARGWGLPVPDDPDQVIYVWWDALGNYVTSLGYGSGDGTDLDRWWTGADRRIHLVGKGVLRFHAVYWPAMLLSAGLALPTDVLVHDYLTVDGQKISKSAGTAVDPVTLAHSYGTDALRWWLLRDVPRVGDADFTVARLTTHATEDLAGGLGNLVNRVVTMIHRFRDGVPPRPGSTPGQPGEPQPGRPDDAGALRSDAGTLRPDAKPLIGACERAPVGIDAALADADFRGALHALWAIVTEANRYIETSQPWALAKRERAGDRAAGDALDATLAVLLDACRIIGHELTPFLPDAAQRITAQCSPMRAGGHPGGGATAGRLPVPAKVFDFDW